MLRWSGWFALCNHTELWHRLETTLLHFNPWIILSNLGLSLHRQIMATSIRSPVGVLPSVAVGRTSPQAATSPKRSSVYSFQEWFDAIPEPSIKQLDRDCSHNIEAKEAVKEGSTRSGQENASPHQGTTPKSAKSATGRCCRSVVLVVLNMALATLTNLVPRNANGRKGPRIICWHSFSQMRKRRCTFSYFYFFRKWKKLNFFFHGCFLGDRRSVWIRKKRWEPSNKCLSHDILQNKKWNFSSIRVSEVPNFSFMAWNSKSRPSSFYSGSSHFF